MTQRETREDPDKVYVESLDCAICGAKAIATRQFMTVADDLPIIGPNARGGYYARNLHECSRCHRLACDQHQKAFQGQLVCSDCLAKEAT